MFNLNKRTPACILGLLLILVLTLIIAGCQASSPAGDAAKPKPPEASQPPAGDAPGKNQEPSSLKDSGTYIGQIDNNSIEIKISGTPAGQGERAFQLSEPVKENFSKIALKTGDQVVFSYVERPNQQPLLMEISKIKN